MIYHLTTQAEWDKHLTETEYYPVGFNEEGFIHASTALQVERTANRIFKGYKNLLLLHVDDTIEKAHIIYENLEGGAELFPHIYRRLPKASIVKIDEVKADESGHFQVKL